MVPVAAVGVSEVIGIAARPAPQVARGSCVPRVGGAGARHAEGGASRRLATGPSAWALLSTASGAVANMTTYDTARTNARPQGNRFLRMAQFSNG